MSTSPEPPYDYAEGASNVEIDEALTGAQPIPTSSRTRRDSQVGSAYSGDGGEASASGAIFDGYGAYAIPSSVTSMHHDRVITWSHDRQKSASSRRPHVRRRTDASLSSSRISRRDSGEPEQDIDDALFASDDELDGVGVASDEDDGRPSIRSRSSLQRRSVSRHSRKLSEPVGRNVFGSLAGIFSRQSLESPRPELSTHRSSASDTSRRRARSRRAGSDVSIARSARSASGDVSDEEMWGYSSGEEDVASPDETSSLTPSYVAEDDSFYAPSEGDMGARSTTSLPTLAGASDPIFGDTRIDIGAELGYEEFSTQPIGGPPSRQRVHLEDEDMTVLFVGCQVITWRKWVWRIATICTFGLFGLAGLWVPTLWLKWVTRERAFEKLGPDDSEESLVVVEVRVIAKLGL